ncbi:MULTISPECIES: Slp family lipoprotein [unclassified Vibrio]|uniref:Slp family lipoprotein n=1 Tax=Vibrio sp. HB236076 TaxID=3232307 RepID=A0AB39H7R7_9VIBR|nr:Slp family lipoprotein [Vibrio sp. HB161653]MDP5253871.1 Slp family lipoprotein [Vibrio sp. HB161653]
MTKRANLFLLAALLLSGCATIPPELAINQESTSVITRLSEWQQDTPLNTPLRLGGVIASVDNLTDSTRLTIVYLPTKASAKPDIRYEPRGRFIVYSSTFLDPVAYAPGRLVTVLGRAKKTTEQSKQGQYPLELPVMQAQAVHLWRVERYLDEPVLGSRIFDCPHPRCFGARPWPMRHKVIEIVK